MSLQSQAGPSTSRSLVPNGARNQHGQEATLGEGGDDLWSEILGSARRQKAFGRKNILVLSERHHGRSNLISKLKGDTDKHPSSHPHAQQRRRRIDAAASLGKGSAAGKTAVSGASGADGDAATKALAVGYEVMHVREDGDEESVPPISIYYPPSSANGTMGVVPAALPLSSLSDTLVMIVLDWSRPARMIPEFLSWLRWIEQWTGGPSGKEADSDYADQGMRDKLQLHIQRYTEPSAQTSTSTRSTSTADGVASASAPFTSSANYSGPLLPLGPGTLTLNAHGVSIIVACTKSDMMDAAGEGTAGIKGNAWEERCDWVQQVLRTVCLAYGAALFYTASSQPNTYTTLRTYILHRLYSISIPPTPDEIPDRANSAAHSSDAHTAALANSRFPFPYRANVLDKEAVVVPTGWDSWGKIKVLREDFEPQEILDGLEENLSSAKESDHAAVAARGEEREKVGLEAVWEGMVPELETGKVTNGSALSTHVEPEQSFLSRHFDTLVKDPNRDPRAAFRNPNQSSASSHAPSASLSAGHPSASSASANGTAEGGYGGVVGPMGAGGLALPGVEKAMAEMEGQGADDLKEKFARLGRKEPKTPGVTSPTAPGASGAEGKSVPNEALHNFFQGLLATKSKSSKSSAPPTPSTASTDKKNATPPGTASVPATGDGTGGAPSD